MAITVVIDTAAKTMRLVPGTDIDHQQLAALGFNEGGDCAVMVRQDIPGTTDLAGINVICTPQQWHVGNTPKESTIAGGTISDA